MTQAAPEPRPTEPMPAAYVRLSIPGAAATDHVRSASIDVIRGTAALFVLLGHAPELGGQGIPTTGFVSAWSHTLAAGVHLFFAVSAFLIAGPFMRALLEGRGLPPVRRYAVRRAARIYPAYWIALAVILIFLTGDQIRHAWQVPVHAALAHVLVPGEAFALFTIAWTLGFEAIFYVLVPVAAVLIRRAIGMRPLGVGAAATIVAVLWAGSITCSYVLSENLDGNENVNAALYVAKGLGSFCGGLLVLIAESRAAEAKGGLMRLYRAAVTRPLITVPIALAIWGAHRVVIDDDRAAVVRSSWMMTVAAAMLFAVTLHHGHRLRRSFPVMATLGLVSYGLYLWHWVMLLLLERHHVSAAGFSGEAWLMNCAILFAATLPLAVASWLLLERPVLLRTAYWDRRRRKGEQPAIVA